MSDADPKLITLTLTRDSVAAGDDCTAPNRKKLRVPSGILLSELAERLRKDYLPNVVGDDTTWSVHSDHRPLMVLPRYASDVLLMEEGDKPLEESQNFYLQYWACRKPLDVREILRRGEPGRPINSLHYLSE